MKNRKITKAVIPAAGFGSRFLPFAKAVPKEMLPIVDTPVIEMVVEEAVKSGLEDILIIISRHKRAVEEHFHAHPELETQLEAAGKKEALELIQKWRGAARIHFVWQQSMRGLGDAVLHARDHVNGQPFALLLGDTLVESAKPDVPVTGQLLDIHEQHGGSVVALEEVPEEKVSRYGIAACGPFVGEACRISDFIEKPSVAEAPSRFAISSRYVFSEVIFDLLDSAEADRSGEIQLTSAMRALCRLEEMRGLLYAGRRHDLGNKLEFLKANILYGLRHPETAAGLRKFLAELSPRL